MSYRDADHYDMACDYRPRCGITTHYPVGTYQSDVTDNDQPTYRIGRHNPRNLYRRDEHMGVVFDPADGPRVVAALNAVEQQPQPLLTQWAMTDEEHAQAAAAIGAYVLPDVTSYLTKVLTDRGVLPVPHHGEALTPPPVVTWADVKANMDKIMDADDYSPQIQVRPPFAVQVKGMLMDAVVDRAVHGDRTVPDGPRGLLGSEFGATLRAALGPPPPPDDQCPACTSPYLHHRFVLPDPTDPADKVIICADDWHGVVPPRPTPDEYASLPVLDPQVLHQGTAVCDDAAHMCPGAAYPGQCGPAPCGRNTNHRAHPLGIPPTETS